MSNQSALSPTLNAVAVINGPNLNLLGTREPEIYGYLSLSDICAQLSQQARDNGIQLDCFQSNAEHELIQYIQSCKHKNINFINDSRLNLFLMTRMHNNYILFCFLQQPVFNSIIGFDT